jgi:effector-binding domain-containing protein
MMAELKLNEKGETGCCPRFNPEPWDKKILKWKDKKFVKARVFTFFYMPINFGKVMKPLMEKIESSNAKSDVGLCLSDHTSKWNMDIYVAVSKEVEGLENVTLSGKFLSKVYEGPFSDIDKWCKDFEKYAKEQGYDIKKWYMSYTTCPACAKAYGKNYVIVIGRIE